MLEKKDKNREKSAMEDVEELKLVLDTVSTEIPALIKNIISSIFSEEAGRNMGKAAAAFYKELKDSGMPNDVALKMTEDYMSTFTSLGNILQQMGKGKTLTREKEKELEKEIRKRIEEKMAEKMKEKGLRAKEE